MDLLQFLLSLICPSAIIRWCLLCLLPPSHFYCKQSPYIFMGLAMKPYSLQCPFHVHITFIQCSNHLHTILPSWTYHVCIMSLSYPFQNHIMSSFCSPHVHSVRDSIVEALQTASTGTPAAQANSVLSLASLSVLVHKYSRDIDSESLSAQGASTEVRD